jgi:hypothetical protein
MGRLGLSAGSVGGGAPAAANVNFSTGHSDSMMRNGFFSEFWRIHRAGKPMRPTGPATELEKPSVGGLLAFAACT